MQPETPRITVRGNSAHVDLAYPGMVHRVKHLVIALVDVRAADDIRISYDFDRDGWRVEQASKFSWPVSDPVCDPDWQEVAFIQAWAREKTSET